MGGQQLAEMIGVVVLDLFNPNYALVILPHGAQVIMASNCFKISHSVADFDFTIPYVRDGEVSKQPDFHAIISLVTKPISKSGLK
jgi:hypothetical protein